MNKDYDAVFEGVKIAVCPGMKNDAMVAAQKSTLYLGCDLLSDSQLVFQFWIWQLWTEVTI
jgi:hypothetical protein